MSGSFGRLKHAVESLELAAWPADSRNETGSRAAETAEPGASTARYRRKLRSVNRRMERLAEEIYDYLNDKEERPRCPSCGVFASWMSTNCRRCGASLWRSKLPDKVS